MTSTTSAAHATASLLLHRQASFHKHHVPPRLASFSTTVANRFFSDNSLGRQKRLIETTKRRQAKARDKARAQEARLGQLQQEYEESMRLRALQQEREVARMEKKLQHAAATYIQYVWRKQRYVCRHLEKRERAASFIAAFVCARMLRHQGFREAASRRIQRQWRKHINCQKRTRNMSVLAKFLSSVVRRRRMHRAIRVIRIQRWYRRILARRRQKAAYLLQRAWRVQLSKKKITRFSRAYQHLKHMEKMERSAKLLQRALGTYAAYRHLVQSNELARYPQVMAQQWPPQLPISATDLKLAAQTLEAAKMSYKSLLVQESTLTKELEILEHRVRELKEKRDGEADRRGRFHALEAYRRAKDETTTQQKLQEVETLMRTEIRAELEKEFEASRRALVREKSKQQQQVRDLNLPADSIDAKQRYDRAHNSKAVLFQKNSSRRRSMDAQVEVAEAEEERHG